MFDPLNLNDIDVFVDENGASCTGGTFPQPTDPGYDKWYDQCVRNGAIDDISETVNQAIDEICADTDTNDLANSYTIQKILAKIKENNNISNEK